MMRPSAYVPGTPRSLQHATRGCLLAAVLLLALGACRSVAPAVAVPQRMNAGEVDVAIVPPAAGAARLELPSTQAFVFPNLIEPVPMPVYPRELLPLRLPSLQVCVEADIDATGTVFAARHRDDALCAAPAIAQMPAFVRSSVEAVRQWHFEPALICSAPPDSGSDDPCSHPQATERPTPIRLSYVFRYSQHDGVPTVERAATSP